MISGPGELPASVSPSPGVSVPTTPMLDPAYPQPRLQLGAGLKLRDVMVVEGASPAVPRSEPSVPFRRSRAEVAPVATDPDGTSTHQPAGGGPVEGNHGRRDPLSSSLDDVPPEETPFVSSVPAPTSSRRRGGRRGSASDGYQMAVSTPLSRSEEERQFAAAYWGTPSQQRAMIPPPSVRASLASRRPPRASVGKLDEVTLLTTTLERCQDRYDRACSEFDSERAALRSQIQKLTAERDGAQTRATQAESRAEELGAELKTAQQQLDQWRQQRRDMIPSDIERSLRGVSELQAHAVSLWDRFALRLEREIKENEALQEMRQTFHEALHRVAGDQSNALADLQRAGLVDTAKLPTPRLSRTPGLVHRRSFVAKPPPPMTSDDAHGGDGDGLPSSGRAGDYPDLASANAAATEMATSSASGVGLEGKSSSVVGGSAGRRRSSHSVSSAGELPPLPEAQALSLSQGNQEAENGLSVEQPDDAEDAASSGPWWLPGPVSRMLSRQSSIATTATAEYVTAPTSPTSSLGSRRSTRTNPAPVPEEAVARALTSDENVVAAENAASPTSSQEGDDAGDATAGGRLSRRLSSSGKKVISQVGGLPSLYAATRRVCVAQSQSSDLL